MASLQALSAASQDRKARLAQLKSLKRKQPDGTEVEDQVTGPPNTSAGQAEQEQDSAQLAASDVPDTARYLSGRNYDAATRGAKLGFDNAPHAGQTTLEQQAADLAAAVKWQQEQAAAQEKNQPLQQIDLFTLQPKKPNWDLKRDLGRKLEVLGVRTDNAIARLVRERIAGQQQQQQRAQATSGDALPGGMDGATLVEATNVREREDEEDARRERQLDDAVLDGS